MRIIIENLYLRVETDNKKTINDIYDHFSVPVEGYWFTPQFKAGVWDGKKKFFNRTSCKLPTGLLVELHTFLRTRKIKYTDIDNRDLYPYVEPVLQFPGFDLEAYPYDYQADSVCIALSECRGVLELATNAGKSIVAAAIIKSLSVKSLYIVATKDSMYQAHEVFTKALKTPIGQLGGGKKDLKDITVAVINSAVKQSLVRKKLFAEYKLLIFNECHHATSDSWYKLGMRIPAPFRFGMSGTAFGGDNAKDWMLQAVTGPLLKKVTNKELIERGISAVPDVVFLKAQVKQPVEGNYQTVVKDGIVGDVVRNCQICVLAADLLKAGQNTLILSPRSEQCWHLFEMLKRIDSLRDRTYFNHGKIEGRARQKSLQEFKRRGGIMIATTIYDEDIDIPQVNALIMALGMKSERKVLQRVGRALRKKRGDNIVTIYDFWDWHDKRYLEKHSVNRLATYVKEEFNVRANDDASEWLAKAMGKLTGVKPKTQAPTLDDRKPTTSKRLQRWRMRR